MDRVTEYLRLADEARALAETVADRAEKNHLNLMANSWRILASVCLAKERGDFQDAGLKPS